MTDEIAHPKLMPVASMANTSQGRSSTGSLTLSFTQLPEGEDGLLAATLEEDGNTKP